MEQILQQLMQEPLMLAIAVLVVFVLFVSLLKKMILLMSFCILLLVGGLLYLDHTGQTPEEAIEEAKDYGSKALEKAKETIEETKSQLDEKAKALKQTNEVIDKAQQETNKATEALKEEEVD